MRYICTLINHHPRRISLLLSIGVFVSVAVIALINSSGSNRYHELNCSLPTQPSILNKMSSSGIRYCDEGFYNDMADSIKSGKGYVNKDGLPMAKIPPGWPLVLAGIYSFYPHPLAAKLFNAAVYAAVAWLLSIAVARVVPEGRVFAPLLVLLYPVGLYTASTLYPQCFGTLLFVAILLLLHKRKQITLNTCIAGFLFGLLVLSIPAFLLISPLILIGLFLTRTNEQLFFIKRSILFFLCMVLIVTPWTIRNAYVFNKLIPVSTNSGVNLLYGNSKYTGPNAGVNVNISHCLEGIGTETMREDAVDEHYRQCALSWIRGNPIAATKLYFSKTLNYFNFRNNLATKAEASTMRDVVMFLSYYPLLLVALMRLVAFRAHRLSPFELHLYLLYFGNALVLAIFFTRIRFRIPFDALLIVIVAITLGLLVRALNEYRQNKGNMQGGSEIPFST